MVNRRKHRPGRKNGEAKVNRKNWETDVIITLKAVENTNRNPHDSESTHTQ